MKTVQKIITLLILFFKSFYLIFSLIFLTLLTYFFEYPLLRNPLQGNDGSNVYQMIIWLDKFWPHVPIWYPLQGGGVSFVQGYPTLYQQVVLFLSHWFNLNILQTMAITNFSVVLLTVFGVYFLILFRFKNQTAALMGGVFLLISPMINIWIDGAGFLAQTFSYIFVAPALLFFDGYITNVLSGTTKRSVLYLVGVVFFSVMAMLAHPSTGIGLAVTYLVYGILLSVLAQDGKERIKKVLKVVKAVFVLGFVWFLSIAFWLFPFYRYISLSNQGFNYFVSDPKTFAPVDLLPTLGFHKPWTQYAFPDLSVTMVVTIFIVVGLIVGFFRSRKVFVLCLLALVELYFIGSISPVVILTHFAPTLVPFIDMRTLVPIVIVTAPVAASLGLVSLVTVILSLFRKIFVKISRLKLDNFFHRKILNPSLVTIFSLAILAAALLFFNDKTAFKTSDRGIYFGPVVKGTSIDQPWTRKFTDRCSGEDKSLLCSYPSFVEKIDINTFSYFCDVYGKDKDRNWMCSGSKPPGGKPILEADVDNFINSCSGKNLSDEMEDLCLSIYTTPEEKLNPLHWPKPHIASVDLVSGDVQNFAKIIKEKLGDNVKRIDISPSIGGLVKTSGLQTDISIMNIYTGQLTLSKPFNGVLRQVLNSESTEVKGRLDEVTQSYGLEGVYLDSADDQTAYKNAGWTSYKIGSGVLWKPQKAFGLASIAQKPIVLQIGSRSSSTYEQVYKTAINGALSYKKFWLVEGKEKIDDYSLDELKENQILILHGYSYSNKDKAWSLLKSYVEEGGRVFIDTGWKYSDKDWGEGSKEAGYKETFLPEPSPVSITNWSDIGVNWQDVRLNGDLFKKINLDKFSPPLWQSNPWEMSLASKDKLREGAYPILFKGDKIIVAGRNYGQGKIIWSGMNSIPHASDNHSEEEFKFLSKVFDTLSEGLNSDEEKPIDFNRDNPDKVIFDINNAGQKRSLFWREYNYPDWKASFVDTSGKETFLPVLVSGARMSLVNLPASSGKLIFEYHKPLIYYVADLLTGLGVLVILLLVVDTLFLKEKIITKVKTFLGKFLKIRATRLKNAFDEDEDT